MGVLKSPTDPNGEIVYTADAYRGVDVLRIDGGGLGERREAPVPAQWFGSPTADSASLPAAPRLRLRLPAAEAGLDFA